MDHESETRLISLLRNQRVGALGTLRDGSPLVTMVLFAVVPNFSTFYIHTSRLAQHTQDMQKDPRVSLMVIEMDRAMDADPQQLARISIRGDVSTVARDSANYENARRLYLKKYPNVEYTFQLGDFDFYEITPRIARYVAGFAKAFNLVAKDIIAVGEKFPEMP